MAGANWTVPPSLQLLSGQNTRCISVTPEAGTPGGTVANVSAQAVLTGGCSATISQRDFTIYIPETPPMPQGYITLELEGGDPCNDPVYVVVWHTTQPYLNGYTSVSPGIVLGGHPWGSASQVKITVCHVNLCSGDKSCIEFWIDRPQPCEGESITTPLPPVIESGEAGSGAAEERNESTPNGRAGDMTLYPNPTTGTFYLSCPKEVSGELRIFDCAGRLLGHKEIYSSGAREHILISETALPKGVYTVQIQVEKETITKKLIVQ
jgi:hypothetical protein